MRSKISIVLCLLLAGGVLTAKDKKASHMPLKEVYLYSSGVGAFLHEGEFSGKKEFSFRFREKQLNDVLKSLFITGTKSVRLEKVEYPSLLPLTALLEGYRIPMENARTLGALLGNMRGELFTGSLLDGSPVSGRLLGVETRESRIPGQNIILTKEYLSLLTPAGFRKIALDDVKEIRPADEKLFAELQSSLALLAGYRNKNANDLAITLQGDKNSFARISYVIESPVWKTSYRLQLPGKAGEKGFLQAWALVENPTSENWKGVKLHLMSGAPVSFIQDLYTSYIPARPVKGKKEKKLPAPAPVPAEMLLDAAAGAAPAAYSPRRMRNNYSFKQSMTAPVGGSNNAGNNQDSGKAGALFRYTVPTEVTLASRKSAMLELLSRQVASREFTLYFPAREDAPFLAAYFVNEGFLLPAGPVTVYSGSSYGGDSQIPDLPAGQDLLLPFAKDLEVKAARENKYTSGNGVFMDAKLVNGLLTLRTKEVRETLYTLENLSRKETKNILLAHEKGPGMTLLTKPLSKNMGLAGKNISQYLLTLAPGKKLIFPVQEEMVKSRFYSLVSTGNIDPALFRIHAGKGAELPAKFKAFLERVSRMNSFIASCKRSLELYKRNLKTLERNHERFRNTLNSNISGSYRNTLNARIAALDKEMEILQKKIEKEELQLKNKQEEFRKFLRESSF